MSYSVFIRPLEINDAKTSYKWRNNNAIWKFTEFKATTKITEAIETAWLKKALAVKNDYRFAICIKETGQYIGNVQLINVKYKRGAFHIFIGDINYWGKGIGRQATELMLSYGFNVLGLCDITLGFYRGNVAAEELYKKLGFQIIDDKQALIQMILTKKMYKTLLKRKLTAVPAHKTILIESNTIY